jgi:uncharacterized damage-inducible protein DinB
MNSLIQYDSWANRKVLEVLAVNPLPEAVKLMGHIIMARSVWVERINQSAKAIDPWQELEIREMEGMLSKQDESLMQMVQQTDVQRKIHYANTKGQAFSNSVEGVLHHLFLHASYHRGQISEILKSKGIQPPVIDYIFYLRETSH